MEDHDASAALDSLAYRLKYIHALRTIKTSATTQRDELLISVFLAMHRIVSLKGLLRNCGAEERYFFS